MGTLGLPSGGRSYGKRAATAELFTTEWRVTWTEDISHRPPYWPHAQLRSETFGDEGHARRWARFLTTDRADITGVRVEHRRVTSWEVIDPFTLSDESTDVDRPS